MKSACFLFLLLVCASALSQEASNFHGKIIPAASSPEGINVINLRTEKFAVADAEGYFTITAMPCDTLMFSAVQFRPLKKELTAEDLDQELVFIKMEPLINELKEVVVLQYRNLNAVSLGIIPAGQKSYTPAERRLKTASGGFLAVDPVLNMFSGRTAMLRRNVEIEKKEFWLERVLEIYRENILVSQFKIPLEYIKGFLYFVVEDRQFIGTLSSKDKTMSGFLLARLAEKYRTLNGL